MHSVIIVSCQLSNSNTQYCEKYMCAVADRCDHSSISCSDLEIIDDNGDDDDADHTLRTTTL